MLIRGLLNRDSVEDARAAALEELAALRPELFAAGVPPHLGHATPGATNLGLLGTPLPAGIVGGDCGGTKLRPPELALLAAGVCASRWVRLRASACEVRRSSWRAG